MKKYLILIFGMMALINESITAQKVSLSGGGGLLLTPKGVLISEPVSEEPITPTLTTDRNVVWVHGFEGSNQSWNRYSDKFQNEYKMHCWRTQYSNSGNPAFPDANSIPEAAQIVQNDLTNTGIAPNPNNIFIAHSMGGLVTREIDRQRTGSVQPELFGGFVTFSTPHKGAIIAKNVMEGKADEFIDDGIRSLLKPLSIPIIGTILINSATINDHIHLISKIFAKRGPALQLASNSDYIRDLGYFNSGSKKIITVAARESGEKLWREVSSLALHPPSEIGFHTYGDNDLPQKMNNLRGAYNGAGIVSAAIAVVSAFKFNPIAAARWGVRSVQFFAGASWIKNAPKVWDNLVGANRTEQRQVTNRQIRQDIIDLWMNWQDNMGCETNRSPGRDCSFNRFIGTLSPNDRDNLYETVTSTVTVPIINEDNDGIVLTSSSNGLDYANAKIETRLRTDLGVNHQECMNHEFITEIFVNDIFSGNRDRFFILEKR